jgi:hypothetical protein
VVAICDADENLFPKAITDIETLGGEKPKTVVDFRELLDNKDIDVISIATPDYWHALMTIRACQAGRMSIVKNRCRIMLLKGEKWYRRQGNTTGLFRPERSTGPTGYRRRAFNY